jgi:hypothetical protein
MNDPNRPKDIIDHIEALAAEHGHFEPVDENYYQAFVELNQPQIEKLAIALMLDQEKEVRRLAGSKTDPTAVARVSKFVRNMFTGISLGFARFEKGSVLSFDTFRPSRLTSPVWLGSIYAVDHVRTSKKQPTIRVDWRHPWS